ncbi:MAG: hypothetical protein K2X77_21005 [Candidatus Obscuribacterales bacterium]|jgi:hypothetical protein|nr:hypothetical protein [Candidatus Obscuribacterales bacterium]
MQTLEQRRRAAERKANSPSQPLRRFSPFGFFGTAFFFALIGFGFVSIIANECISKKPMPKIDEVLKQAAVETSQKKPLRHTWGWWLSKLYLEQTQAPDVVIFGSSLVGSVHASIDAQLNQELTDVVTHRRANFLEKQFKDYLGKSVSVFSLACPGEMISDAFMITKTLFSKGKTPKVVIAAIAPRDFVDSTLPHPGVTDQFKFFSNYVKMEPWMESAAYPEFFARMGEELDKISLKRVGKIITGRETEKTPAEWESNESLLVEPGKSVVPANARPPWTDNSKEYIERFRNPINANYRSEMLFFREWIADLRSKNIEVLVVCMPTLEMNRKLLPESFWKEFRSDIANTCKQNGADWFDLSDVELFVQSDYLDTVHLGSYGGVKLFPILAHRVKLVPKLRERLIGP